MAVKFLEPGGDATFIGSSFLLGTNTIATDYVHGGHIKSYSYGASYGYKSAVVVDAGGRFSLYVLFHGFPAATTETFMGIEQAGDGYLSVGIDITPGGVLKLRDRDGHELGSGSTLSLDTWYRVCLSWVITSTTVNELRVYLNGTLDITATNVTIQYVTNADIIFGSLGADATFSTRLSDFYVDNSTALTDTGNIWVTAKRPFANGTAVEFTTQIGTGNSGYGSGHADEVNERALSETNGWSLSITTTKKTEEYNIEGLTVGDFSLATIVDYMGWIWAKVASTTSRVTNIIVNNVATAKPLTTSYAMWTQIAGSSTYPAGTGTDIGMDAVFAATARLASLAECGIVVAFIPATALTGTVTASITEADIVTGGKTIILTLSGDKWIAAGALSFDLQRQNIINGLDSAQSELLGWDNVVKALQAVTGVVRTSDTVVTITLDAQATYNITATETITATVPATALTGGVALVASPTFAITATAGSSIKKVSSVVYASIKKISGVAIASCKKVAGLT